MSDIVRGAVLPASVILCYSAIELIKKTAIGKSKIKELYPLISTFVGVMLGVIAFFADSAIGGDALIEWALRGMAGGLSATGADQLIGHLKKCVGKTQNEENEERR